MKFFQKNGIGNGSLAAMAEKPGLGFKDVGLFKLVELSVGRDMAGNESVLLLGSKRCPVLPPPGS